MSKFIGFCALTSMLISSLCIQDAYAGAWTVPKNKIWAEYYMKWDYGKETFIADGGKKQLGLGKDARSWKFVMEPKLEYGVTDWANLLFGIEYKESHYKEYGRRPQDGPFARKNHGITNVKLGGKVRMLEGPLVMSMQGKVFIYPGYGNYHGDDPAFTNQPSIGYGDDAFEYRVLIGKAFDLPLAYKIPCYFGIETGYRWRTRHVNNDIPYIVEGGFWPVPWFLIKSEIDGYKGHEGTGSIEESYGTWRIGGVWQVFGDSVLRQGDKLFNIEFDYGMTVWGKNTTAYQEWTLKVQTQF